MPRTEIPKYLKKWDFIWNRWHTWLFDYSASSLDTCLAFALSYPEVDKIIVGADSCQQWESIIDSAGAGLNVSFPSIGVNDSSLINPSNWPIRK
jgi:hypothetical protein